MQHQGFASTQQRLLALGFALLGLFFCDPARAEDESEVEASQRAVTLGHEALEAFERADHEAALQGFKRAEDEAHSPVFVLYMARSEQALGHLLEARALFEQVSTETLPEGAPEAWQNAKRAATTELESLAPEIPSLLVVIEGPDQPPYHVRLGPHDAKLQTRSQPFELDPGSYSLEISDAAGRRQTRELTLAPGERERRVVIEFPELTKAQPPPKPAPRKAAPRAPPREPARAAEPDNLPAWAALGVGLAGAAVGVAAGSVAWAKARDVHSRCDGTRCPPELRDDARSARTWANVASVGFLIGIVGVGGSVVLWDAGAGDNAQAGFAPPSLIFSGTF